MKYLKSLLGKKEAGTPTWDITPAAERPAPKKRRLEEKPLPVAEGEPSPFQDAILDTIQLETFDAPKDNPYQGYNWELDPENDRRKLKAIQTSEVDEKKLEDQCNPYDAGNQRRGWKK